MKKGSDKKIVFKTFVPCRTPHKKEYPTRAAAKKAGKLMRSIQHRDRYNTLPVPYKCPCGAWHLGHPSNAGRRIHPSVRET